MSLHWQAWRDRGADPWVVEVLRWGYRLPFARVPSLSQEPIPMPSYVPMSTKGVALEEVTRALISKGAVELAPLPSPGFYSRLFVVWKTSGSWRPVTDLSHLNLGLGVPSPTSLTSTSFSLPLLSRWRPSSLFFSRFVRGIGWCPSI